MAGIIFAALDAALNRINAGLPAAAQYNRMGRTTRWLSNRVIMLKGKSTEYQVISSPGAPIRRSAYATAAEASFPEARTFGVVGLSFTTADLAMFQATARINELEELRVKSDPAAAISSAVLRSVQDANADMASEFNAAHWQDTSCSRGTINALYDLDGTAFTGGAANTASILKITDIAPSYFNKGDILEIIDSDGSTFNTYVKVWDVIYTEHGWHYDGTEGVTVGSTSVGVGPGLIAQPCDASGTVSASNYWNTVADPAATDILARSDEHGSGNNFKGFGQFFSATTNVYRNADGGSLRDRDDVGENWSIPTIYNYTDSNGDPVVFNFDDHFSDMEDDLPSKILIGRQKRPALFQGDPASKSDGMILPEGLVVVGDTKITRTATQEASASGRFTAAMALTLEAGERRRLFGDIGFGGVVYHSPNLPSMALHGDPAATKDQLQVIDPSSWLYFNQGGDKAKLIFLDHEHDGKWFREKDSTTGRATFYIQAAAYASIGMSCDQIGANVVIKGITSA